MAEMERTEGSAQSGFGSYLQRSRAAARPPRRPLSTHQPRPLTSLFRKPGSRTALFTQHPGGGVFSLGATVSRALSTTQPLGPSWPPYPDLSSGIAQDWGDPVSTASPGEDHRGLSSPWWETKPSSWQLGLKPCRVSGERSVSSWNIAALP